MLEGASGSQAVGCAEAQPTQERWKEKHPYRIPSGLPWDEQGRVMGAQMGLS